MENLETPLTTAASPPSEPGENQQQTPVAPPPGSYVKHAMRNMVRKRGTSIKHFVLTTVALLGVLVGLAYLTR